MSDTDSVRSLSDAVDSDSSEENESLNKRSDNGTIKLGLVVDLSSGFPTKRVSK